MDAWMVAHPTLVGVAVMMLIGLLTALGNWLARAESAEEWEKTKAERPRLAGLIVLARAVGLDPAKVVRGLSAALTGKFPTREEK